MKSTCPLTAFATALALAALSATAAEYSWQEPHANVLPNGELEWAPKPFVFEKGESVRYIDFEGGSDDNNGLSKDTPWKHHPWDAEAAGASKACKGIHTYVFKRGAIYRGRLLGRESGAPGNPIRLTSDPSWGAGEAAIFGSVRFAGGWTRADARTAPGIPEPEKVWYRDIGTNFTPHGLWELQGTSVTRIAVARDPNWTMSDPNDPQKEWYAWTAWEKGKGSIDTKNLTQKDPNFFDGGHVWTEWTGNMGTIHVAPIRGYDPAKRLLQAGNGRTGNRYFIENVRGLLDATGEFFFDPSAGRLFVRMPGDRDPNGAVLEASRVMRPLEIRDSAHIVISGLRFSFDDPGEWGSGWPPIPGSPTCVRLAGNVRDIRVSNCRFLHVQSAVAAFPRLNKQYSDIYLDDLSPWREDLVDEIEVSDNDVAYADRAGFQFAHGQSLTRVELPPYGKLGHVCVLRNRLYHVGNRPGDNQNTAIPTVCVLFPERAEIAGNLLRQCWGSGIFVFGGKPSGDVGSAPLTRILIHHNRIQDAMLACNDYGGMEYWQGGPMYVYSNISGNSVGYRHCSDVKNDWKTVAYNFYLDGTFKTYTFNNIIWGRSNDPSDPYRNRGGFFVVLGFMDHLFNNTIYKFRYSIAGSSGNRTAILGNVLADASGSFIQQNRTGDTSLAGGGDTGEHGTRGVPTLMYASNVFAGKAGLGNVGNIKGNTVEQLRADLEKVPVVLGQVGWQVPESPMVDAPRHDFRLKPGSPAADRGVKFFVPWSLARTVGEWNFYRNASDPGTVLGENFYMSEEFAERHMYDFVPRNDLRVTGATAQDYVAGTLEDWIEGALAFDGARVAVLADAGLKKDVPYPVGFDPGKEDLTRKFVFPAAKRETVDVGANNFLVEAVFRTDPGHAGGTVAGKMGDAGYALTIGPDAGATLTVKAAGKTSSVTGGRVNDGAWHHVIAECDRGAGALRIYVDGRQVAETKGLPLAAGDSLSNAADFQVGKGLVGAVDFVRVSRGTLADAKTTIEELYAWEFSGPFLRDFCGTAPAGRRDAGALECLER